MRYIFITIVQLFCLSILANEPYTTDTLYIDEVSVTSEATGKYQVGVHSHAFTTEDLEGNTSGNIAGLISKTMPVYIKSDAGGLSSIRLRGTAPDHTSIMVGGININSLTLGYSNSSTVPTYLFDNVTVQMGNSSAEVGSGAIGGTVKLGLQNNWTDGFRLNASVGAGSFGEYTAGMKIFWGNGKFENVIRLYDYRKENNFEYTYLDRLDEKTATQNYAAVHNRGILNEINYRFNATQYLTSFVWLENNVHDKQPTISDNNADQADPGDLENKNIRSWIEYNDLSGFTTWKIGGGYVKDNSIDNGNVNQAIGTQRINLSAEAKRDFNEWGSLSLGTTYKYIVPEVYAYEDNLTEQQTDVYLSYAKTFWKQLQLTSTVRQQWVTEFDAPLTPSLGLCCNGLHLNDHSSISLLANASRNYRIPTLNDRYWGVDSTYTGNPDLKAEDGYSLEFGVKYLYNKNDVFIKSHVQAFHMDIDDWIMWLPTSIGYEAVNIQRVISRGIETSNKVTYSFNNTLDIEAGLNYTYNPVKRKESDNAGDNLDLQLEYVPKHVANLCGTTRYKNTGASISINYTGERNATQVGDVLEAYTLINAEVSHKIALKSNDLKIALNGDNILNKSYQNQLNYAMPGRSFRITINYKFK